MRRWRYNPLAVEKLQYSSAAGRDPQRLLLHLQSCAALVQQGRYRPGIAASKSQVDHKSIRQISSPVNAFCLSTTSFCFLRCYALPTSLTVAGVL